MKNKIKRFTFGVLMASFILAFTSCIPDDLFNTEPRVIYIEPITYNLEPVMYVGDYCYFDWFYYMDNSSYDYCQVSLTGEYSLFSVTTSNPYVLSVSDYGRLDAVGPGTARITVTPINGSTSMAMDFYVSERSNNGKGGGNYTDTSATYTASSLYLDYTSKKMTFNSSDSIYYSVYPYYVSPEVTCESSDTKIVSAYVSGDSCILLYAGSKAGTATITVTSVDNPNVYATCVVTVSDGYEATYTVSSISISDEYLYLDKNETAYLTASVYPSSAPSEVTWSSSKETVATVSSAGYVTAVGPGTAIITVKSRDNPSKTASCEVTVSNNTYVKVTGVSLPTSKTIEIGEEITLTATVTPSGANPKLTWYTSSSSSYFLYTPDETDSAKCTVTGLSEGYAYLYVKVDSNSSIYTSIKITVTKPAAKPAHQFFWGTWIRMDKGTKISIEDTKLISGSSSYDVDSSDKDNLVIRGTIGNGISSFKKKSQNVIEAKEGDALIPFYRQGGTNLDYSLKVVGHLGSRAASGLANLKVRGTSNKFKTFKSEGETKDDGSVTLKAPVQGDIQTVVIDLPADEEETAKSVIVDNLKVENSGDYMGTVALAGENDYSLKITGTIDQSEKTDGYLYAGNTYTMHLEIKNISDVSAKYSVLSITPDENDTFISLSSNETDMKNLKAFSVPTIKPGMSLKRDIQITIGDFPAGSESYKDTKINVEIKNDNGWIDYVPIRIFREQAKITFQAGVAFNKKTSASLNGFLIYPDGNSQFFSVPQASYKTISVPRFKSSDEYILVFSGATVQGTLDDSTELYYTVSLSNTPKALHDDETVEWEELRNHQTFGEENETEDEAYPVSSDFEAYIAEGETDFYKLTISD